VPRLFAGAQELGAHEAISVAIEIGQLEAGTNRLAELKGDEVQIALALKTDFEALAAE